MMKPKLYILTMSLLVFGCKNTSTETTSNLDSLKVDDTVETEPYLYNVYKTDSVSIDMENDNFDFSVLLTIGGQKREYDLTKLNIPTKSPTGVDWSNDEYAAMMTWWSQSQSRHIFIPMKRTNELIYINKVIEETDSVNNNVVYVDSVIHEENKVVFRAENLLTRKSKAMEFVINEQNCVFPFFEKIALTKEKLTITTVIETKSIDIREIGMACN